MLTLSENPPQRAALIATLNVFIDFMACKDEGECFETILVVHEAVAKIFVRVAMVVPSRAIPLLLHLME